MNNLDAIYDFILNELRKLTIKENFYFKPIKPKLSDLELYYPEIVDTFFSGFFDIVIGNPPYVDIKALPKNEVRRYFQIFKTVENRINLYSIFLEKGSSLLNSIGILSYINPNSILVNESYRKIRKYLLDGVEKIIKLPDSVFETATVETIILFTRSKSKKEHVYGSHGRKIFLPTFCF